MAVNGRNYDHEDCRIELPGGEAFGIEELNYEDGQDVEARYGKGAVPRKYGHKNYEASGSLTMDRDQFEQFVKALESYDTGLYDHKPFPIIASYGNDDMPTITDTLPDVKFTKISTGYKQGEANASSMKIDYKILSPIKWNGIPAKKG